MTQDPYGPATCSLASEKGEEIAGNLPPSWGVQDAVLGVVTQALSHHVPVSDPNKPAGWLS